MAQGSQARDGASQIVNNVFEPSGTTVIVTSAGTSVASSAFAQDTICRIVSNADCHYKISAAPTASTSDVFLPSKAGEQILIKKGNKIAVIGTVTLYVTPLV
jgi:hypothetical protein